MLRRAGWSILLLLLLPWSGAAQAGTDAAARIEAVMQRARASEIPVSLIQSKVAEGRAKGVPEGRIAAAVEQRFGYLSRAREVMQRLPQLSATDLSVGADALEAGVSEAGLERLAQTTPAEQRAVAIAVMTQLVHLGEPPAAALSQVMRAVERGPDALQRLPAEAAGRQGRGPSAGAGQPGGQGRGQGRGGSPGGPPSSTPAPGRPPGAGRPDSPGNPNPPGKPDNPGRPSNPGNPNPGPPGNPGNPGNPNPPGNPGNPNPPGNPGNPNPGPPGNPGNPNPPGNPGNPNPGRPGNPNPPGNPGNPNPGRPGNPGNPNPGNPGNPKPGPPGNPGNPNPPGKP